MIRVMWSAGAFSVNSQNYNTADNEVHITPVWSSNQSSHSTLRGSVSSYAASATKPDIKYTLEIATEVPQYMAADSAVPSFDRVKKM